MKILVPTAAVFNPTSILRLKSDQSGIDTANVKLVPNPFDEVAAEEAVRMKERGVATETVVVAIGPALLRGDVLLKSLAQGIDRAIHVVHEGPLEARGVAEALKVVIERENPGLVLMGRQTSDFSGGQVGPILAALLNWPQATFASKIELTGEALRVTREVDGGLETREMSVPAIVTVDLRLNEPRYYSLPSIMKAKQKPTEILSPADLGVDFSAYRDLLTKRTSEPPRREAGVMVADAAALAGKLLDLQLI